MENLIPQNLPKDFILAQTQLILKSYRHWLGKDLILLDDPPQKNAAKLFHSPFVVVSSNAAPDPLLNYGNQIALDLWEMPWEQLIQTPGRKTAEPMLQEEREKFLTVVKENGFIENYSGVRISSRGKRFRIQKAVVWNLIDDSGAYLGQAATFTHWEWV